jgi:D-3-phosphoglycerate dehydrogenase
VRPAGSGLRGEVPNPLTTEHRLVAGTILQDEPRLVRIDDYWVDVVPAGHVLITQHLDRPGMIGRVGSLVGQAGINISDMDVGRSASGVAALMVISTDNPLPPEVVAELRAADGILHVATVSQE